jgi:hypothetical protein
VLEHIDRFVQAELASGPQVCTRPRSRLQNLQGIR